MLISQDVVFIDYRNTVNQKGDFMVHLVGKWRGPGFKRVDPKYRPVVSGVCSWLSNLRSADFYLTLLYVEVLPLDGEGVPRQPDTSL